MMKSRSDGTILTIFETVSATRGAKMNMAMKLKNAAHSTATRGERTRVDTTVAIELAASWNPLIRSNRSAMAMVTTTMIQRVLIIWDSLTVKKKPHVEAMTISSIRSATCLQRLIAFSRRSKISFHLMKIMGWSSLISRLSADRTTSSPWPSKL
jgi:hypothetical protein